jgi:hypothetical protein
MANDGGRSNVTSEALKCKERNETFRFRLEAEAETKPLDERDALHLDYRAP